MCDLYQISGTCCLQSWLDLPQAKGAKSAIYDCLVYTCYLWPWLNRSSFDGIAIMLCISGFVDDVMFLCNGGKNGPNQRRRVSFV